MTPMTTHKQTGRALPEMANQALGIVKAIGATISRGACLYALSASCAFALTNTSTSLSASLPSIQFGQSVRLTAAVTGSTPTGSVVFSEGGNSLGTATVVGDPYWANVSLLLHGDGTNGSTSIVDDSKINTVTANGAAQIESSVVKFGSGAIQMTNSSVGWISMPGNASLDVSSGDFTLELWVYATVSRAQIIANKANGNSYYPWQLLINADGNIEWRGFSSAQSLVYDIVGSAVSLNAWHHLAAVRAGSAFTLYLDGVAVGSATFSDALFSGPTDTVTIGAFSTGQYPLIGYVDDVRITKGIARYLTSFASPTSPFLNSVPAATLAVNSLTVGSHTVTASYGGDTNNSPSTSTPTTVNVSAASSVISLVSPQNPSTAGGSVTLTAAVTPAAATGTVSFLDGGVALGSAPLSAGSATLTTSFGVAGIHILSASYSGDASDLPSTSLTVSQTVSPAITQLTASASPTYVPPGGTVALKATLVGAAPTGVVTFSDNGVVLGSAPVTASQATASFALSVVGLHNITAAYAGDANNQTASTSPMGVQVGWDAGGVAGAMTWLYGYDPMGNRVEDSDPLGHITTRNFDALDRPVQLNQPDPVANTSSTTVNLAYDAQDHVTAIQDPRSLTTSYTVDAFGNTSTLQSPDTGTQNATFDAAGNLLSSTDARGLQTGYVYDALNRLTQITYASGVPTTFGYDGGSNPAPYSVGRLTSMTDESGSTAYAYDAQGHVLSKTQTTGAQALAVGYAWGNSGSAQGHLTSMTYPSGMTVSYAYDSAGRVNAITVTPSGSSAVNALSAIAYNGANAVAGWTWSDGTLYQRGFDNFARLSSYPLGNPNGTGLATGMVRVLSYDNTAQITGFTHMNANGAQTQFDQSFSYDNLGRLTSAVQANVSYSYSYDASGNRTVQAVGASNYIASIAPTSNQVQQVLGTQGTTTTFGYDGAGNMLSDSNASYTYSARGRMSSSSVGGALTSYLYNGLDQRVSKSGSLVPTGVAYYVYDEAGQLLGEYNASSQPLYETVYLGTTPVAVTTGGGVYNVWADHTDTPRVITRASDQAIVWRWDTAEPFGVTPANANPSNLGTFTFDQRFPGQIFDIETGNFYNWHRDYKPAMGRYVQSDPIGLGGGINTYAYVNGNPLGATDPSGLQANPFSSFIPPNPYSPSYQKDSMPLSVNDLCVKSYIYNHYGGFLGFVTTIGNAQQYFDLYNEDAASARLEAIGIAGEKVVLTKGPGAVGTRVLMHTSGYATGVLGIELLRVSSIWSGVGEVAGLVMTPVSTALMAHAQSECSCQK